MCVGKNTSQAANVRVVRFSGQRVRCSGLQKIVGKGSAFFDKLKRPGVTDAGPENHRESRYFP